MTAEERVAECHAIIEAAEDYEMPAYMRLITRIINGVPPVKAGALFMQEITLARAKAAWEARP